MTLPQKRIVQGSGGRLAVYTQGNPAGQSVMMTHSILSSSLMWEAQAELLAGRGFYVIRVDARGHGASSADSEPFSLDDLAADSIAVLDSLQIAQAHYVGLSLGGMSGFGLGIHHARRLLSLILCDCRADAPAAFTSPWDERIAIARKHNSCAPLAQSTIERWFGLTFVEGQPAIAHRFRTIAASTSVDGFVGCARALQQLDYLPRVKQIAVPTTLIVGADDGPLPAALRDIQGVMPAAALEVIPDAGHLPNVQQPEAFNAALLRHFESLIP